MQKRIRLKSHRQLDKGMFHKAISENKLTMKYQPIVRGDNLEIFKYEALLRLHNNQGGFDSPQHLLESISTDEDRLALLLFVTTEVIKALSNLDNKTKIAMNLSYYDIESEYIGNLLNLLKKNTKEVNEQLVIEIIETSKITKPQKVQDICKEITQMGIELSLDDFGIENSNLFALSHVDFSFLKIDGHFIKRIKEKKIFFIIRNTIRLCKELNIKIVAEHIEDIETLEELRELGVDLFQGFFLCVPKQEKHLPISLNKLCQQ